MKTSIHHPVVSSQSPTVLANRLLGWLDCGPALPGSRVRRFPPPLAAAVWLLQCLFGNISCQNVLGRLSFALRLQAPLLKSAYIQARERLSARQLAAAERSESAFGSDPFFLRLITNRGWQSAGLWHSWQPPQSGRDWQAHQRSQRPAAIPVPIPLTSTGDVDEGGRGGEAAVGSQLGDAASCRVPADGEREGCQHGKP